MSQPSTQPVTVAVMNDHELIVRGIAAMLLPYQHEIRILELDSDVTPVQGVDVVLYDTFTRANLLDPGLASLVDNPLVGRVVLFTWLLTDELVESARLMGVHAAIPKTLSAPALAAAIRRAHAGDLDLVALDEEPDMSSTSWPGRAEGLTAREAEIIVLVTCGLSNVEISARTYLSINSVKSYIRTAYRTMGVTSRSQAVLWGVDHGLRPRKARVLLPQPSRAGG